MKVKPLSDTHALNPRVFLFSQHWLPHTKYLKIFSQVSTFQAVSMVDRQCASPQNRGSVVCIALCLLFPGVSFSPVNLAPEKANYF